MTANQPANQPTNQPTNQPDSQPVRAFLGLGSNLGDSKRLLAEALASLANQTELVAVSSLYCSAPVGGPEDSPVFFNLVAELRTRLGPYELLAACAAAEMQAQRVREVRWGPRTLDVDVLLYDDLRLNDPDLTIPHPRMLERRFVMDPLAEIAPDVAAKLGFVPGSLDAQDCHRVGPAQ